MSEIIDNLGTFILPGLGLINKNKEPDVQTVAADKAAEYMKGNLDYQKNINEPLIKLGDEQITALKEGIESGAFGADEGIFNAYQQYVAPQYEPGGMFQYEDRSKMVTPERFQTQYNTSGQPQLNYQNPYYQKQDNPAAFQYQQQAPQFQAAQQPAPWQNTQFRGQQYMTQYQPYQQQARPDQIAVNNQFQTGNYQQQGQQPDIYRAGDAPDAQYFDPTQNQYQRGEFSLQDDPVYQRRLENSSKAIEASAAARGMQLSGANLKALQENAQGIAAEEGDAAFNRYMQQEQMGYNQFQDQRAAEQQASQYQNEDQYRRYLDSVGIRGAEADKAIQQFNTDRQFGAEQNKETWLREQASKQLGMNLNDQQFSQWLATDGQQYAQYAGQRDWATSQSNMNADRDWQQYTYEKGFGRDVYTDDRNFNQAFNLENYNAQLAGQGQGYNQALATNAQNYGQFADNRAFDYGTYQDRNAYDLNRFNALNSQYNQNLQNQLAVNSQNWGQQMDYNTMMNNNYATDRAFNYGVNQDYNANQFNAFQYNVGNQQQQNLNQYGMLTDAYSRQLASGQQNYGMIGDLVNLGMQGSENLQNATSEYYGTLADLELQKANAAAAAAESKASRNTLLGQIGL
jgi:hypothetical protein